MAATLLGAVTIGGALIGLSTGIDAVAGSFSGFRATVASQTLAIDGAVATLGSQAVTLISIGDIVISLGDVLTGLKASLRLPVAGDLDAQIAAILQAQVNLGASLTNPVAYITGLVAGATQAITNLTAAVPTVQIAGQITAAGLLLASLQLKVAAIDAALAGLDFPIAQVQIQGAAVKASAEAIQIVIDSLQAITDALDTALASADASLAQLASIQVSLGTAGAYAFTYSGTLGGLGAAIDLVTPLTGVAAGTLVFVPLIFVEQANTAAMTAVSATYRVS